MDNVLIKKIYDRNVWFPPEAASCANRLSLYLQSMTALLMKPSTNNGHVSKSLKLVVYVPFFLEKSPVEAKLPWLKQAQELEETRIATEEPT